MRGAPPGRKLYSAAALSAGRRYNYGRTGSACPEVATPVAALQNIPMVSWVVLRGRCAHCGARSGCVIRWSTPPLRSRVHGCVRPRPDWPNGCRARLQLDPARAHHDRLRHNYLPDSLTCPCCGPACSSASAHRPGQGTHGPLLERDRRRRRLSDPVDGVSAFKLMTGKEGMGYGDFKLLAAISGYLASIKIIFFLTQHFTEVLVIFCFRKTCPRSCR